MVRADPKSKKVLFPQLASVPLSQLESHPQFVDMGSMVMGGLKFVLNNAGDAKFLKLMVSNKSIKSYFLPDIPISRQLEVRA